MKFFFNKLDNIYFRFLSSIISYKLSTTNNMGLSVKKPGKKL